MSEKTDMKIGTPGAIIIGAIIIGLAVVFALGNKGGASPDVKSSDNRPTIQEAAKKVGVNQKKLEACIAEDRHADTIQAQMDNASAIGFKGTPHSVVIENTTGKKVSFSGARPIEHWQEILKVIAEEDFQPTTDDLALNVSPVLLTDHVRGSENPRVTIIEYSDIDCPFCAQLHETMIDVLDENDDVQWIYRHMPIAGLHPNAYEKASASECVYELSDQNDEVFWEYLDLLIGIK